MKTRHTLTVSATCPVNGDFGEYRVDVYPDDGELILGVVIVDAVEQHTHRPVTQEALTRRLADHLGCKVRSRGSHCGGRLASTVVCYPQVVIGRAEAKRATAVVTPALVAAVGGGELHIG